METSPKHWEDQQDSWKFSQDQTTEGFEPDFDGT